MGRRALDGPRGPLNVFGFRRKGDPSPSVVQLVKSLVSDALRLVRVEVELVKARFSRTLKRAGIAAGILVAAAGLVSLGGVGILVAAGLALAIVLPGWAAALIVAGTLFLAGSAAAGLGLAQLRAAMAARSSGPVDIETERQETRYRLEAELEALSSKLDPRHRAHTVEQPEPNGGARALQRTPR